MKIKAAQCRLAAAGAPIYLAFAFVYLLPLGITCMYAFLKNPVTREFHPFYNFSYLLSNRYFLLGIQNLLIPGLFMVLASLLISLMIAPLLMLHKGISKFCVLFLILPLMIPSVSAAAVWKNVFETRSLLESGKARTALVSLYAWKYAGLGSVILFSALRRIPQSIPDAAKMDGAGRLYRYIFVYLPCIPGEIGAVIIINIVFMLRIYKESYLLFGAYPSEKVYMLQHYMNHQYTNMSFQHVAAGAVILILLALILYGLTYAIFIKRRNAL